MSRYIIRRVIQAIPVIFLIAIVSFLLMLAAPGGPQAQFNQNPHISSAMVDQWLKNWCLERNPDPVGILREFGGWLGVWNCSGGGLLSSHGMPNFLPAFLGGGSNGVLHLDFGLSITTQPGRPVLDLILERLPATLLLMVTAFVIWVSVAIVAGVIAAVKRYSLFDQVVTFLAYIFYSLPTFWLGLILIFIFAVALHWLPSQGIVGQQKSGVQQHATFWIGFWKDPLSQVVEIGRHLILPVVTLVAVSIAADSRFVRSSMLDTLSQDYVRTAKAKGLPQRAVIFRHAFRNALLPIMTNVALEIAFLFSGAIVTETVFSWPGMGRLYFDGINNRDYFLLMGILLIGSIARRADEPCRRCRLRVGRPTHPVLRIDVMAVGEQSAERRVAVPSEIAAADNEVALESLSQWQLAVRRFRRHRLAMVGVVIFAFMIGVAVFGPIVRPFDPLNLPGALKPGGDPPSLAHIFGTDETGRDVFSAVLNGARISMAVGIFSVLIAGITGVTVGSVAGYFGGWVDNVLMRIVDVLFAIPFLFIILVAAKFFGQGDVASIIVIFGVLSWPIIARLVRASFLSLREADFVDAARAVGVGDLRIAFRHILPNALGPVIVAMTLLMAANIVTGGLRQLPELRDQGDAGQLGKCPGQCPARADARRLVVGVLPGHGDRAHCHRHQLHR